jgi:hypothetical protein
MRITVAACVVATLAVMSLGLSPDAKAQAPSKTLRLDGTTAAGVKVAVAADMGVTRVIAKAGGPYVVSITAGKMGCIMQFSTAADAAAIHQRVLDPKTLGVTCMGTVTVTERDGMQVQVIQSATDFVITANP